MKNLKMAFFMNRDKYTESMKPLLLGVLARTVFFPDGQSLLEKWNSTIETSSAIKTRKEVVSTDSYNLTWLCNIFNETNFQIAAHYRHGVENNPVNIGSGGGASGSITLTKIDEYGNTYDEVIPYGTNASINQYTYVIPVPTKFTEGKTVDMANAAINITEGHESDFIKMHTLHNVFSEYKDGNLYVYVNHFNGLDAVDMTELSLVTGDFNISINGIII